jgi:serine/threonine-protein kinase
MSETLQYQKEGLPFGRYRLLAKLAVGGMAELFVARQQGVGGFSKMVVIKCILPYLAQDQDFISMFLSEARLAAHLNHPNVVQIYDVGELEGIYYMTMEYIPGQNLRELTRKLYRDLGDRSSPPFDLLAAIFAQAAAGLSCVHNARDHEHQPLHLVHRDLSPNNLILSYDGQVKIVDFGVAKARSQERETEVGVLKGRLSYMSPEQISGQSLDGRSDIFSLGVVLYELTTNRKLFRRKTEPETIQALLTSPIPSPRHFYPDYPHTLEEILLKMLRRNPQERYANAQEVQQALEDYLALGQKVYGTQQLVKMMDDLFGEEKRRALAGEYEQPVTPEDLINLSRGSYRVLRDPYVDSLQQYSSGVTPSPAIKPTASGIAPSPNIMQLPQQVTMDYQSYAHGSTSAFAPLDSSEAHHNRNLSPDSNSYDLRDDSNKHVGHSIGSEDDPTSIAEPPSTTLPLSRAESSANYAPEQWNTTDNNAAITPIVRPIRDDEYAVERPQQSNSHSVDSATLEELDLEQHLEQAPNITITTNLAMHDESGIATASRKIFWLLPLFLAIFAVAGFVFWNNFKPNTSGEHKDEHLTQGQQKPPLQSPKHFDFSDGSKGSSHEDAQTKADAHTPKPPPHNRVIAADNAKTKTNTEEDAHKPEPLPHSGKEVNTKSVEAKPTLRRVVVPTKGRPGKPLAFRYIRLPRQVKLTVDAHPQLCQRIEREVARLLGSSEQIQDITLAWQGYMRERAEKSKRTHHRYLFYPRAVAYVIYTKTLQKYSKKQVSEILIKYQKGYRFKKFSRY